MPTAAQAYQFALMVLAGVPPVDAVAYFQDSEHLVDMYALAREWQRSPLVAAELVKLQKGDWTALSAQDRIKLALDKHYNEMAYFLYSHNYSDLDATKKSKADTCRVALEQKLAGMAGVMSPLASFWQDVQSGKVRFPSPSKVEVPLQ